MTTFEHAQSQDWVILNGRPPDSAHRRRQELSPISVSQEDAVTRWNTPADWLRRFTLERDVVSCGEAATAKGISVARELKSLVLETDAGPVLAHLSGEHTLSLRKVKKVLGVQEARLASPTRLDELQLRPGIICPFLPQLWCLPQLITKSLLEFDWVTTNDGTLSGYFIFDPLILLGAESYSIAHLER